MPGVNRITEYTSGILPAFIRVPKIRVTGFKNGARKVMLKCISNSFKYSGDNEKQNRNHVYHFLFFWLPNQVMAPTKPGTQSSAATTQNVHQNFVLATSVQYQPMTDTVAIMSRPITNKMARQCFLINFIDVKFYSELIMPATY